MTEAAHAVLELGDVGTDGGEQVTVYIEDVNVDETVPGVEAVEEYTEEQEISVEELQQVLDRLIIMQLYKTLGLVCIF